MWSAFTRVHVANGSLREERFSLPSHSLSKILFPSFLRLRPDSPEYLAFFNSLSQAFPPFYYTRQALFPFLPPLLSYSQRRSKAQLTIFSNGPVRKALRTAKTSSMAKRLKRNSSPERRRTTVAWRSRLEHRQQPSIYDST